MFGRKKQPPLSYLAREATARGAIAASERFQNTQIGFSGAEAAYREKLEAVVRQDEQWRLAAHMGVPEVFVTAHQGGTFMKIGDFEAPIRFIEGIVISHRPERRNSNYIFKKEPFTYTSGTDLKIEPGRVSFLFARLCVIMSSGRKLEAKVNPYNLEATFARAVELWKAGEIKPVPVVEPAAEGQ